MSAGELWRRLQYLMHRSRFDRELREEMAAHRVMKLEDEPSFGNERRLREYSHDVWGWSWLDRLLQDLTFAQRLLRRSPVFTLTAIAVLAIGLGVSLAGIQILDAAAFKPLPVKEPDTLVRFTRRGLRGSSTSFSYAALTYYTEHDTVLAAAMGIMVGDVTLGDDPTRHETVQFVTSNYLEEIGATARLGRILDSAQDDAADAEPAIVLSSRVWRDRFGGDPAIVGSTVRVNDHPFVVVGVTAETLVGISEYPAGAWMPISRQTVAFPGSKALTDEAKSPIAFFARLKPGVSENSAEDALRVTAASLRAAHPDAAVEGEWLDAGPAGYYLPLNSNTAAGIAVVATFFLLFLMATCANLGTLMLSRAVIREREMAIRVAVGATSRRILRQLLTESCVLGALGAAAGMWVSVLIGRLLLQAVDAPAFLEPRLDARVLSATVGLAALATIAFGLAPALHVVRPRRARPRSSNVFVGAQVTAACTLLVLSALLLRALDHVLHVPLGFDYTQQITIDPALDVNGFAPGAARAYWTALEDRLRTLPAVRTVALASLPPLGHRVTITRFTNGSVGFYHHVDPRYFDAMGIALVSGRGFGLSDRDAVVVSESFGRATWPGEPPLGKTHVEHTVIGVAANARTIFLNDPSATEVYLPMDDEHVPGAVMIVRVVGDPRAALPAITQAAHGVDARVAPTIERLAVRFENRLDEPRRVAAIVSMLGLTAVALAAVGLGGLVAFTVSQCTREIGIRIALGARPGQVVHAVLSQFRRPLGAGAIVGFGLAAFLAIVLRRELLGLSSFDPVSYAGAAIVFLIATATAALAPLRRALRVDPVTALRSE